MKKGITLFLILALCLGLWGCNATDQDNRFEMPEDWSAPSEGETATTEGSLAIEAGEADVLYPYGNVQSGTQCFIPYEGGFLFVTILGGEFRLCVYDPNASEVRFVCKDPTCSHRDFGCPNRILGIEPYGGTIYGTGLLDPMKNVRTLAELKNGRWEKILDGDVQAFWHHGGNLYVTTADGTILCYEGGKGTPKAIVEDTPIWSGVIFDHYLYNIANIGGQYIFARLDLLEDDPQAEPLLEQDCYGKADGTYIYYTDPQDDDRLYRCNMDGSEKTCILEEPVYNLNFDEEYVYYRLFYAQYDGEGCFDVYRFPKDDPGKTEKIATLPENVSGIYTVPGYDRIFVETTIWDPESTLSPVIYTMHRDGSDIQKLNFPEL